MARTFSLEDEFTFVIDAVPPSLNYVLRMHWRARRHLQLEWARKVWAARAQQGAPITPMKKAKVSIERRSPRLLDLDNAYGAAKVVVDALKADGIIVDDSPEHISLTVTQVKGETQTTIHVERAT